MTGDFLVVDAIVLFPAGHYPGDIGFIAGTRCRDGDPLEVLILVEEPTSPGCRCACGPSASG